MNEVERLSHGLSGIAGEYLAAGELSRRGYMASITLRNNDSIDIHASKLSKNKILAIQVKTNQNGKRIWLVSEKAETLSLPNLFYIFVSLKGLLERPEYFIVPSAVVAQYAKERHQKWIAAPKKNGDKRKISSMRKFADVEGIYLERWDILNNLRHS